MHGSWLDRLGLTEGLQDTNLVIGIRHTQLPEFIEHSIHNSWFLKITETKTVEEVLLLC